MKRSLQKYYMQAKRAQTRSKSPNSTCLNSYEIQSESEFQPGCSKSVCSAEKYETESNSSVASSVTDCEDFHFENINTNNTNQLESVESSAELKPLRQNSRMGCKT